MVTKGPVRAELVYVLDGDVESIDVFRLVPTLQSLGRVIQASARIAHPLSRDTVSVKVRPFAKGSFEIHLLLLPQAIDHSQQIIGAGLTVPAVLELLKDIGLIKDVRDGLIQLIKKGLTGKEKPLEQVGRDNVRSNTLVFAQNATIVHNTINVVRDPFGAPGVTSVRSFLRGEAGDTEVSISKDDLPQIDRAAVSADTAEETIAATRMTFLKPSRGSFGADPNNWTFLEGDTHLSRVTISDREFLQRHESGELRLNVNDVLTVEIREVHARKGGKVTVSREIVRVLRVAQN